MGRYFLHYLDALADTSIKTDTLVMPHHGSVTNIDAQVLDIDPKQMSQLNPHLSSEQDRRNVSSVIDSSSKFSAAYANVSSFFLEQVNPETIVISSAKSYYGHPDELTLATIAGSAVDPSVFCTDIHGDVVYSNKSQQYTCDQNTVPQSVSDIFKHYNKS